ncbi:MAG: CPBP family intramembrane glutamic endopeptidase [Isosphaeraceae bacterium]
MKTTLTRKAERPLPTRRRRLKFGYDGKWWGVSPGLDPARQTYAAVSKGAWPSLVFVAPLLILYEFAVVVAGGTDPASVRGAADLWMRQGLGWIGLKDPFWVPFLLAAGLLIQHVRERRDWRFAPVTLPGMILESAGYALALIGLGKLIDLGFAHLDGLPTLAVDGAGRPFWLDFLGAGLYEEVLFRWILVSLIALGLALIGTPKVLNAAVAMVASALVFALAHHFGAPGESFTWYAFIFRWTAGVVFAWIFLERGFGIAVGTHTAYDMLVGCFGWHL